MFFETNVREFDRYKCVYYGDVKDPNGRDIGSATSFPHQWADNVGALILNRLFRGSIFYGVCSNTKCPVMHLKGPGNVLGCPHPLPAAYTFHLAECACIEIAQEDRHAIVTMRDRIENIIVERMRSISDDLTKISVTFWCSGRLLGELVTLIKIIEVITHAGKSKVSLQVNFIDKEYSDYIVAWFLENQLERHRDPSTNELPPTDAVCPTLRLFLAKRLQDNGTFIIRDVIHDCLGLLRYSLSKTPNIDMRARFFATGDEYKQICSSSGEQHDILIGHDIEATWEPMRDLHKTAGHTNSCAVAWSKKLRESLELKQMTPIDEDWQQIEEIALPHSHVHSQALPSCSAPVFSAPSSSSSSSSSAAGHIDLQQPYVSPLPTAPIELASPPTTIGNSILGSASPSLVGSAEKDATLPIKHDKQKPTAAPAQKIGSRRTAIRGRRNGRGGRQ